MLDRGLKADRVRQVVQGRDAGDAVEPAVLAGDVERVALDHGDVVRHPVPGDLAHPGVPVHREHAIRPLREFAREGPLARAHVQGTVQPRWQGRQDRRVVVRVVVPVQPRHGRRD